MLGTVKTANTLKAVKRLRAVKTPKRVKTAKMLKMQQAGQTPGMRIHHRIHSVLWRFLIFCATQQRFAG